MLFAAPILLSALLGPAVPRAQPHFCSSQVYSSRNALAVVRMMADGGDGGGTTVGGGGGGGDGDGEDDETDLGSMVAKQGLELESLPADMVEALKAGRIGATEVANWAASIGMSGFHDAV